MPKQLFINPDDVRKAGVISFKDIPVNQYSKTVQEESGQYSKEDMLRIYRDMRLIREFE